MDIGKIVRKAIRLVEDFLFNRMSFLRTVYFNFHYLPFKQAVKLPIYLRHPHFMREWGGVSYILKGQVIIDGCDIKRGMIRLGFIQSTSHHDGGIIWSNEGRVVFRGPCKIASGSAIRNGGGTLIFGKNYSANPNTRFFCYERIEIGDNVVGSWDVTMDDYDFHAMKDAFTGEKRSPYGKIIIGNNNWIGQNVIILKNTITPDYTTISAGSVVTGEFKCKEKSIIKGNPAVVVSEGKRYMDIQDCYYTK